MTSSEIDYLIKTLVDLKYKLNQRNHFSLDSGKYVCSMCNNTKTHIDSNHNCSCTSGICEFYSKCTLRTNMNNTTLNRDLVLAISRL